MSCSFLLQAAELEVDAYADRTTIGVQDALQYTIEVTGSSADKIGTPSLPEIDGFTNSGVSTSSSSSYTLVNGSFQSSVTKKYIYTLLPQKTGRISIPSITIKYKKQQYKTRSIMINVVPGSNEPAPATSNPGTSSSTSGSETLADNLFIDVQVSNQQPYQNEPVTVNYTLYSKYQVTSLSFQNEPAYTGFWKEDVFTPNKINFTRSNRNGQIFNSMVLKKVTIFPSQTGDITVEPLAMNVDIRTESRSFFDFGSSKTYTIKSKSLKFKVKPLPEGAPDNFNGAVGSFSMDSSISESKLKVGDSFTWSVTLTGQGNFNNLELGRLSEINHLRFLDPEISTQVNSDKISGSKTIRYLVIAQEPGSFSVPPLSFSYFDYKQKKYRTLRTSTYQLDVTEGDKIIIAGSTSQSAVHLEGSDIGFIINHKLSSLQLWFDSLYYWLLILLLFITFPFTLMLQKRHDSLAADFDYQRQKKAARILKKYLKLATEYQKTSNKDFYAAAQSGMSNYLTDKLKIAKGSRSEEIINIAAAYSMPAELIAQIQALFLRCNEARFMPGGFSAENINQDFDKLKHIITELTRFKLKRKN